MSSKYLINVLNIPMTEEISQEILRNISHLDDEDSDMLLKILTKEASPEQAPDNIQKIYNNLQNHMPDFIEYFAQNNFGKFINIPFEDYTPYERSKLLLKLLLLEVNMKYSSTKIKQHLLQIGRDLYNMKQHFDELSDQKKFAEWYTSMGFKRDFVSLTLKKYDLYLLVKNNDNFKKTIRFSGYNKSILEFFEALPIRAVKAISKKTVPNEQKIEYLIALFQGEMSTTEVENEIKENNKTFNLTRYIKLITKIDRHKKKYQPSEMKELINNFENIERQLNRIIEREKVINTVYTVNLNGQKGEASLFYNATEEDYEKIDK